MQYGFGNLNENYALNIMVLCTLVIVLCIVLFNISSERSNKKVDEHEAFEVWAISALIYVFANLAYWILKYADAGQIALYAVRLTGVIVGSVLNASVVSWIISRINGTEYKVEEKDVILCRYSAYPMPIIGVVLLLLGEDPFMAIPWSFLYYAIVFVKLYKYRLAFQTTTVRMLVIYALLIIGLGSQTVWREVPVCAMSTMMILSIYLRVWQSRNEDFIENQRLLVEKDLQLAQSRVDIMVTQIQPHFIFNSLAAIRSLCGKNPQKAQEAIGEFADYLRVNLDSLSVREPVPFEKELEHINTYLRFEKLRMNDRLTVREDIRIKDFEVPPLSIQPLVENAVRHGVFPKPEGGTVSISTHVEESGYIIVVADDGVGFAEQEQWGDRVHVGLDNVKTRLEILSGATLKIESEPEVGTKITVTIPLGDN